MDLNELLSIHQIALIRAGQASEHTERRRFHAEADCVASRVHDFQRHLGAAVSRLLPAPSFTAPAFGSRTL